MLPRSFSSLTPSFLLQSPYVGLFRYSINFELSQEALNYVGME